MSVFNVLEKMNGVIENGVNHRIRVGLMMWRSALVVLCDCTIPIKLKIKFYKTTTRLVMLFGIACWAIMKQYVHKMSVVKMRMLRC